MSALNARQASFSSQEDASHPAPKASTITASESAQHVTTPVSLVTDLETTLALDALSTIFWMKAQGVINWWTALWASTSIPPLVPAVQVAERISGSKTLESVSPLEATALSL